MMITNTIRLVMMLIFRVIKLGNCTSIYTLTQKTMSEKVTDSGIQIGKVQ
jgi:hypothetical protein